MGFEENANCARTYASFRLVGSALDADEIAARTGINPDGLDQRRNVGVWWLTSEDGVASTSIERHLRLLLDVLNPHREALLDLIEERGLRADFFCYWASATGHGGPEVLPQTLDRIAALGASLGFDFYGV